MKLSYCDFDCIVKLDNYRNNNNLAIQLLADNTSHNQSLDVYPYEPIDRITVNLDVPLKENQAFVSQTTNERIDLIKFFINNDYAFFTGVLKKSGYNTYLLIEFTPKFFEEVSR